MVKQYLLVFYTVDQKQPEHFENDAEGMKRLFARIVELTKRRAKFVIYEVGGTAGDFS